MNQIEMNHAKTGMVVSGEIRFKNVVSIRQQGNHFINTIANACVEIDLSKVTLSDASGLSLLIRWIHDASQQDKQVQYVSIPIPLLKIAKVCGVDNLIRESIYNG